MSSDDRFMRLALALAAQGAHTSPNPMVGCVVVKKGRIVGRGFHKAFGLPHAETEALRRAGARARGATLYINLEPCCHWGKTPPCADKIISAGIKRVVSAMEDPNPLVRGKGFRALKAAGISVTQGIGETEARVLNRAFIKRMTSGLPYIILKTAMSLDGKIAAKTGDSRWISSPASRHWVHQLRAKVDAIVVGKNTVAQDNPHLTSHGLGPNPLRVIMDKDFQLPLNSLVFDTRSAQTLVATRQKPDHPKAKALQKRGVKLLHFHRNINLNYLLKYLSKNNMGQILLEGGGKTNAAFLEAGLVDELCVFVAPLIIGGSQAITPVEGTGVAKIAQALKVKNLTVERIGSDFLIRGHVYRNH